MISGEMAARGSLLHWKIAEQKRAHDIRHLTRMSGPFRAHEIVSNTLKQSYASQEPVNKVSSRQR